MDATTKKGREAISLMLQGKRIAAQLGHGDGAPEWAFGALAHIDNLETVCTSLRTELERAREALRDIAEFATKNEAFHSSGSSLDKTVTRFKIAMKHVRETAARAALSLNHSATPDGSPAPYEPSEAEIKAAADNLFINVRDRLVSDDGALTHRMKQWEEVAGLALIAAANARRTP